MGWFDKIRERFMGAEHEWDDAYDDGYEDAYVDDDDDDLPEVATYASPFAMPRRGAVDPEPTLRPVPTGSASVTSVSPQVTTHIVEPRVFSEAQLIADKFKSGSQVIMKLTFAPQNIHQRLIDFASGLTYGLDGEIKKIDDRAFLLAPHNVDVASQPGARQGRGLFTE